MLRSKSENLLVERKERKEIKNEAVQKLCLTGICTEARAASRTYFAPEYGFIPFPVNNVIVDHNFEELNPFNSELDHMQSLREFFEKMAGEYHGKKKRG